jgi:hypothetical protein
MAMVHMLTPPFAELRKASRTTTALRIEHCRDIAGQDPHPVQPLFIPRVVWVFALVLGILRADIFGALMMPRTSALSAMRLQA